MLSRMMVAILLVTAIGCGDVSSTMLETDGGDAGAGTSGAAGAGGMAGMEGASSGAGTDGSAGHGGSMGAAGTTGSAGAGGCGAGQTACPVGCSVLSTDHDNCGACGKRCPADAACVGGACTCPRAGWVICGRDDSNGGDVAHCVNPQTDTNYCGSCSTICGVLQACIAGVCQ